MKVRISGEYKNPLKLNIISFLCYYENKIKTMVVLNVRNLSSDNLQNGFICSLEFRENKWRIGLNLPIKGLFPVSVSKYMKTKTASLEVALKTLIPTLVDYHLASVKISDAPLFNSNLRTDIEVGNKATREILVGSEKLSGIARVKDVNFKFDFEDGRKHFAESLKEVVITGIGRPKETGDFEKLSAKLSFKDGANSKLSPLFLGFYKEVIEFVNAETENEFLK